MPAEVAVCPVCTKETTPATLHQPNGNTICQVCQVCGATFFTWIIEHIGKEVTIQQKIKDQYIISKLQQI